MSYLILFSIIAYILIISANPDKKQLKNECDACLSGCNLVNMGCKAFGGNTKDCNDVKKKCNDECKKTYKEYGYKCVSNASIVNNYSILTILISLIIAYFI